MTLYEVRYNSDLTEGRGPMVSLGWFAELNEALEQTKNKKYWVMGVSPSCEIWELDSRPLATEFGPIHPVRIWGYRRGVNGRWGYGFLDLRDEPENDPEYEEYLRLKEKFDA
jgi:hypothetical protein